MVAGGEQQLWTLVVHARFRGGFYVAIVPAELSQEQVEAPFRELGIDGGEMFELGGWRTTLDNVAVTRVPFPGRK